MVRWPILAALVMMPALAADVAAQVAPPAKEHATTQTYLVGDILRKRASLGLRSEADGDAVRELVRVVCSGTGPKNWLGPKANCKVEVLHGDRLEVTAPAKVHEQVKELLEALRRLGDVAVRVDVELYALDAASFAKKIEPGLTWGKGGRDRQLFADIDEDAFTAVRKHRTAARASKLLGNGEQGRIFSLEQGLVYRAHPSWAAKDGEVVEVALHGLQFHAHGVASADRRFVTLKLEQRSRELVELNRRTVTNPITEKEEDVEVPQFTDTRRSVTRELGDGAWLAVVLPAVRKDEVRLVLIHPTIHIEEEQKALKLNE